MTPAQTTAALAVLHALVSDGVGGDEASGGPPERCIAPADLLAMGDAAEARDERAMWGDAA